MTVERRLLLILAAACLVLFSFQIGNHDFWDPDEPRYAGVTRSLLERGEWLRLTDNGAPYTQKPPFFFWLLAASAKLGGGVTELTARVPASLAALLCAMAVFRLGSGMFNPRVGWLGAMALATAQRFFVEARWVHMDTMLSLCIALAMESAYRALQGDSRRWPRVYLWMALGCLIKGPVAILLPVSGILVYLATVGEPSRLRQSGWLWGLPLSLMPSALWLIAAAKVYGSEAVGSLLTQLLQRFGSGVHHPRPTYYYLISLPLEFLPWTLFLPSVVRFTLWAVADRKALLFLYGWVVGGLALLSVMAEKRPSYLIPLFPALALLTANFFDSYLTRFDPARLRRWMGWPILLAGVLSLAGTIALGLLGHREAGLAERAVPLGLVLTAGFAGALWAHLRGRRGAALLSMLGAMFVTYLGVVTLLFPWLNPRKSARPFSERIVSRIDRGALAIYGDYIPAIAYYTHRDLKVIRHPEALAEFLEAPKAYGIVPKHRLRELKGFDLPPVLDSESIGHREFVLLGPPTQGENQAGEGAGSPR